MPKVTARPKKKPAKASSTAANAKRGASIAATLAKLEEIEPKTSKAKKVVALLKSWLEDESGYDERTWPLLKRALEAQRKRVGARRLIDE